LRLVSIPLVALLVAAARAAAEGSSEAPLPSADAVHGAAADESPAERDVGQPGAAPIERSGSSAHDGRVKASASAPPGLLPFIILKSIERPFMMSPK